MPKTYEIIKDNISVISARDFYEKIHPNNPKEWKSRTFLDFLNSLKELV